MTLFDPGPTPPPPPSRPAARKKNAKTTAAPSAPANTPPAASGTLILQFDGGSRGNPGPAGIGVTLSDVSGKAVYELGEYLGRCTNNVAEYTALVRGLDAARQLGAKKVIVRSDSELVVRQVNGQYKVKSPDLKPLYQRAISLMGEIGDVKVNHVFREGNTRADKLANLAMDSERRIEPLGPPTASSPAASSIDTPGPEVPPSTAAAAVTLANDPIAIRRAHPWTKEFWSNLLLDKARTPDLCGPTGIRQNNFDLIRCAMAILVIFSHSYAVIHGKGTLAEPLERWTGGVDTFGGMAVNVFFILSGFLIAMSWERSSSVYDYVKRRVLRIYPGFAVAMLFCALVICPLFTLTPPDAQRHFDGISWRLMKNYIFSTITLHEHWVPGVFLNNPLSNYLNSSVWTIRFEFGCYLLVMALGLARVLRNRWAVLGFFCVAQGSMLLQRWSGLASGRAMQKLFWDLFDVTPETYAVVDRWVGPIVQWPGLVTMFSAGMLFYAWRDRIPKRFIDAAWGYGLMWCVMLCCMKGGTLGACAQTLVPVVMPITLAYSVFWLAFQPYVSFPRFAKYGDFSYGIYLYAFPIQQAIKAMMGDHLQSSFLNFLMATPITIILAIGSWYGVERFFIKRKNKSTHVEDHGFKSVTPVRAAPVSPVNVP